MSNDIEKLQECQPLLWVLGDADRLSLLQLLSSNDRLSVGELTQHTVLSRPAVSHHLRILYEAGCLEMEKQGVKRYYRPAVSGSAARLIRAIVEAADTFDA